ncbi:Protein CBG25029, partial [Caenorhabditis briggsae]
MLQKPSKNSRLAEHTMSHLKTWNILVKTFHIPEENLKFFENSDSDFFPFLPYSMNKKRRWEVDFLEDLAGIQKSENFEILFLERTRKGAYDWPKYLESTMSEQFRIRVVHRISRNPNFEIYEKQEINSIFGQDFKNFEASKSENSGIIAYNFIKSPENSMKIFGKKCISEKDNSWPYTSGWIRVRRQKNLKKELKRFEIFEENSEENSEFLENLEPQKPKNQK